MNKRGQMYILAAIILSIAIFSVMKVTNKFVSPSEDNFDFFVENFNGERSYVMNLGVLEDKEGGTVYYLKNPTGKPGLLELFQQFGINTGIVLVEYNNGWIVSNFLGEDVGANCEGCDSFIIPSSAENIASVSFSVTKGEKKWMVGGEWEPAGKYYTHDFGDKESVTVTINENDYVFSKPLGGNKNVESLIFKNVGKNYVKVVKI